ncbi:MAG: hypothetical protein R2795_01425 [Saprospiraceae bacterium]
MNPDTERRIDSLITRMTLEESRPDDPLHQRLGSNRLSPTLWLSR